jgi:hypothetical protein
MVQWVASGPGIGNRDCTERHRGRDRQVGYGTVEELERRLLMTCDHCGRAMGRREERAIGRTVEDRECLRLGGGLLRNDRVSLTLLKP